jgi:hypothetical protein
LGYNWIFFLSTKVKVFKTINESEVKKMKKLLLASILISLLAIGTAWGSTFTLNDAALLMLWEVFENPVDPISQFLYSTTDEGVYGQPMSGNVGFVGTLRDPVGNPNSPFSQMGLGANFWGAADYDGDNVTDATGATTAQVIGTALGTGPTNSLVGYNEYSLYLENDNDDIWWVNIFINTGYTDAPWNEPNNYYENGWTALAPFSSTTLTIDLTTVANLNHVTNIGFNVGANLTNVGGNPSNPDTYHISAAPIPEPSTIILLGFGFLGLAAYGWHRKKKSEAS